MPKPLYIIRTDAVLIHPSLPGFPITDPPRMAASPNSIHAQFMVGHAIKPISWFGILSWYGIKQPNRARIWPLRALLHLYLMVSLRDKIGEQGGPSEQYIRERKDIDYQTLLDSGVHYMGNFWVRFPEMMVLALQGVKEQYVAPMINTLFASLVTRDKDRVSEVLDKYSETLLHIRAHIQAGTQAETLGLTRRRAGIIERALHACLAQHGRMQAALPALSTDNPLIAAQRAQASQTTLVPGAYDVTTPRKPPAGHTPTTPLELNAYGLEVPHG